MKSEYSLQQDRHHPYTARSCDLTLTLKFRVRSAKIFISEFFSKNPLKMPTGMSKNFI
jgi:hypothetical protein